MILEIPEDVARRLVEQAERESTTPVAYVERLLAERERTERDARLREAAQRLYAVTGPVPPLKNEWFTLEARYEEE